MGERGKNDEMKSQKTSLEPSRLESGKPEPESAMGKTQHKPEVRLGREAQARIGQQLRDLYQKTVQEGVPAHLADLVNRLSEQD